MKLAKVLYGGQVATAIVESEIAKIISPWVAFDPDLAPFDPAARSLASLRELAETASETKAMADVLLVPPTHPLSKLICLGLNYRSHVDETHNDLAAEPGLFIKVADALVGQNVPVLRPKVSERFDYEGEIAVVIGKAGRHISKETALEHVFGYTIMMDGSVRDYQKHSVSAGKNFWRSGSLGPWIVTADEIPDPTALTLETRLNGEIVQSTRASLMLYDIPTAIAYISTFTPLAAGDIIATGTPGGVGARRTPPLWMKAGDLIEVEVSAIGNLRNPIVDE